MNRVLFPCPACAGEGFHYCPVCNGTGRASVVDIFRWSQKAHREQMEQEAAQRKEAHAMFVQKQKEARKPGRVVQTTAPPDVFNFKRGGLPTQDHVQCDKCRQGIFIERTNARTGRTFWGCSRFPECKGSCDYLHNGHPGRHPRGFPEWPGNYDDYGENDWGDW